MVLRSVWSVLNIIVGCPIYQREWIFPYWLEHLLEACGEANLKPDLAFVVSYNGDRVQKDQILELASWVNGFQTTLLYPHPESEVHCERRTWNANRYQKMVEYRNLLLEWVRRQAPDYFLSLDSDILLQRKALVSMLECMDSYDAVGGKCYMTERGTSFPSYAVFNDANPTLRRSECTGVIDVKAIMAIKLMSPTAYAIDYEFDTRGEDIGWSKACTTAGLKLGWDGRVTSKHVMSPERLLEFDERVGF